MTTRFLPEIRAALSDLDRREAEHGSSHAAALADLDRREAALIEAMNSAVGVSNKLAKLTANAAELDACIRAMEARARRRVRIVVGPDAEAGRIKEANDCKQRLDASLAENLQTHDKTLAALHVHAADLAKERSALAERAAALTTEIAAERETLQRQEAGMIAFERDCARRLAVRAEQAV